MWYNKGRISFRSDKGSNSIIKSKSYEIFLKIFKIFEIFFKIFGIFFQDFFEYFSKIFEIFEICFEIFEIFSKISKISLKKVTKDFPRVICPSTEIMFYITSACCPAERVF